MSTSGVKGPQSGLVDMGDIGFYKDPSQLVTFTSSDLANYAGSFSEIALNVTWAQLQPTENGPIETAFIQDAINAATSIGVGIKMRVWGGFTAPEWAKSIDGAPLAITDEEPGQTLTIGRFWTADYIDAWTSFQKQLANLYDGNPIIRGISNTAGASGSDEPFVPLKGGLGPLQAVGYTDQAQILTLRAAIADYSQWSTTPLDYTMNLFHQVQGSDPNVTLAIEQQARNSTRLVQVGNHALNVPWPSADAFVYAQLQAAAALDPSTVPGSYQTASPGVLKTQPFPVIPPSLGSYPSFTGDYTLWPYAVANGVLANAGDIELWDGPGTTGFTGLLPSQVQTLAAIVAAGTAPMTGAPADGSALGFIAPAHVTGSAGPVAFSGVGAVLLASTTAQSAYTVTLTSTHGGTLSVSDPLGIVIGSTIGSTLTLSGPLSLVNTVLASLTDTLQSGTDVVRIVAVDGSGHTAMRDVGVQIAPAAAAPVGITPSPGPGAFASNGVLVVGGVESAVVIPGDLEIGTGGSANTLLAALAPNAYSTANLSIGGTLEVLAQGAAHFSGSLGANAVSIDAGGTISGDGTLAASGTAPIVNNGTIEAVSDLTLGLQRLTVSNVLTGTGRLLIDPGATLVLHDAVGANQTIEFAANSITQFANSPYSPSTLVIQAQQAMQGAITGFSLADRLVLDGVAATSVSYAGNLLTVGEAAGTLAFRLSGDLAGLTPSFSVGSTGTHASTTIAFTAAADHAPRIVAPNTLEGAAGTAVLVPDIVVETPFAAALMTVTVAVTPFGTAGQLAAGNDNGNTTVTYLPSGALQLSGFLGALERSLQTLTYQGAAPQTTDTITITVSDGTRTSAPATITVHNNSTPSSQFDWASPAGGSFSDPGNWMSGGASGPTAPGGANIASFGTGTYTVSGNGAVGELLVTGTTTLTGQVTAQGVGNDSLIVDTGGVLTLAGGAQLTAQQQVTVGVSGTGLLTLMGGALSLIGAAGASALVIGEHANGSSTVVNLEQITADGTMIVGDAGTGKLALLGVAASVYDGAAVIGHTAGSNGSVTVNGGFWANVADGGTSGLLTVGDSGNGVLLINGAANGITGQVTTYNATLGANAGSQGTVMLDGGELLVANINAQSNTLIVGGGGAGSLTIDNGGEAAVGVAAAGYNGLLSVGATAGGRGRLVIGDLSALLVYGNANVGGAGDGEVTVGSGTDHSALFATAGTLAIGGTGHVMLGGTDATVRASILDIAAGGSLSGSGTLSGLGGGNHTVTLASIDNEGSIMASGGDLLIYGGVSGSGTLTVDTGATLTMQAGVGSGQTLAFGVHTHVLLNDPHAFAGLITSFGSDDVLELASTHATGATWSDGVLTLATDAGSMYFRVSGAYDANAFTVQSDNLGGTNVLLTDSAGGYGDVHMVTFNGLHYDFQALGDFVAVQATDPGNFWQIQIRTASYPGAASITTELAAQLGGDRVTFAIGRDFIVHVDGAPDMALQVGAVQSFANGTLTQLSAESFKLAWNTGESVTVTDHGDYLDWSVALGPQDGPGSVRGLLGSNSGEATDFKLPDGTVLAQPLSPDEILGRFADAWRVAPHTSLFDDMIARDHDHHDAAAGHGWLI